MTELLANPIWHSLSTRHSSVAEGNHLAKRYPEDIGPLAGILEQSDECWEALKALMLPGQHSVLFLNEPAWCVPGLTVSVQFPLEQMICRSSRCLSPSDLKIEDLAEADVPEMLGLTALTEPGPFRDRTICLGGYCGIRDQGRLVAMAGRRTAIPGYREVSAVCTHPSYRGRGYGAALVCAVSDGITAMGEVPYLHVRQSNSSAISLYRRLGYEISRTFYGTVVMLEDRASNTVVLQR
jgi:ribosomal protein S18 acetylase RimI-like enzyme